MFHKHKCQGESEEKNQFEDFLKKLRSVPGHLKSPHSFADEPDIYMSIYNGINVCKDENDYEFIPDDKDAEPAETNTGKLNIKILEGFDDDDNPKIKTTTEEGVTPKKIREDVNRDINEIVDKIKEIQKSYISDSKYLQKTTDEQSNRVILLEYKGQLTTLYRKLNAVNKYLKKPNAYKDLLCDFNKKYSEKVI